MDRLSRRRPWLRKLKQPGNSISSLARKYEVHLKVSYPRRLLFKLPVVKSPLCLFLKVKNLQKQVRELQRLLGKKTMEVEILREAL